MRESCSYGSPRGSGEETNRSTRKVFIPAAKAAFTFRRLPISSSVYNLRLVFVRSGLSISYLFSQVLIRFRVKPDLSETYSIGNFAKLSIRLYKQNYSMNEIIYKIYANNEILYAIYSNIIRLS